MQKIISFIFVFTLFGSIRAQSVLDYNNNRLDDRSGSHFKTTADSVTTKDVPIGYYMWKINERFGDIIPTATDTLPHLFQNTGFTEGIKGEYNTLGNMGSPRYHRIFMRRNPKGDFIFTHPYDFFLTQPNELFFTNTLSPYTNITYHESGDKTNGEDRIRAYFAVNANKRLGFGFKLDYLYGRGYYENQSTADFNGTLFGSYIGRNYTSHLFFSANHLKTAENGGIEDDRYITNPEVFPNRYNSRDIPTMLNKVWNKLYVNTFYYTQKYSVGFYRSKSVETDSLTTEVAVADSLTTDSIATRTVASSQTPKEQGEFVPVTSFIHTLRADINSRKFIANEKAENYYADNYFVGDSAQDKTRYLHVGNTLAVQLHEGFNKWAKAGMKLFASHDFHRFSIPKTQTTYERFIENDITVGALINKTKGNWIRYNLLGQATTTGDDWGEFKLQGDGTVNIPFKKDTLNIQVNAEIRNERPSFYYRHYHSKHVWWDNDNLDKEFRSRIEGTLSYPRTRTRLAFGVENIKNHTYFAATNHPYETSGGEIAYSNGVTVNQAGKNIQIVSATLNQDMRWGILNWENELTYQASSDKTALPLPALSLYSNLYLKFNIARVLLVEFGGDIRYFTEYDAPTYVPAIGQFANQAAETLVKIGNYPIIDVYANFRLKSCRFYIMGSHVNRSSDGGHSFLVPHYPINPLLIKFGLSWNFYN